MVVYLALSLIYGAFFLTADRDYYRASTLEMMGLLSIDVFALSAFYFILKKTVVSRFAIFIEWGALALKKSNITVLIIGVQMLAAGLIITPFCTSKIMLDIFLGLIVGSATGALCMGVIMGAITRD